MVIDELEAQAQRLGLTVTRPEEPRGYLGLLVRRDNHRGVMFNFEHNGSLRSTDPCWVPANSFPGNSEEANLDWGMAVLLRYAGAALDDPMLRPTPPPGLTREISRLANAVLNSGEPAGQRLGLGTSHRSYLIPLTQVAPEDIIAQRRNTTDMIERQLLRLAVRDRRDDLVIRSLEPRDVGLRRWGTPPLLDAGWQPFINHVLGEWVVIGVYGVYNRSRGQHVTQMRFSLGNGERRGVFDLASLYGLGSSVGLFTEAVYYFVRNERMVVEVQSDQNRPKGERIGLLGFIGEPIGQTVAGETLS